MCLATLHRFDEAYAQWETLINDRSTPDADIGAMRISEWNIMYDKGYICGSSVFQWHRRLLQAAGS
ncbi:MAG TPA: hypothetical protein VGT08_21655 [Terracidiphilus sp.]|nr:hypothetical protein [Terracidiphilus sp.]